MTSTQTIIFNHFLHVWKRLGKGSGTEVFLAKTAEIGMEPWDGQPLEGNRNLEKLWMQRRIQHRQRGSNSGGMQIRSGTEICRQAICQINETARQVRARKQRRQKGCLPCKGQFHGIFMKKYKGCQKRKILRDLTSSKNKSAKQTPACDRVVHQTGRRFTALYF